MSEKLAVFVGFLRDLNSKLISTIKDIEGTGKGLFNEIDELIGNIRIHNDVTIVIGEVMSHLGILCLMQVRLALTLKNSAKCFCLFHHIHQPDA